MYSKSNMVMLSFFGAMMASQNAQNNFRQSKDEIINKEKPKPKNPKGTQEYYFDVLGEITPLKNNSVFHCIATNKKNAIRKFKNWKIKI